MHWKKPEFTGKNKVNVDFHTQDPDFDSYMKWDEVSSHSCAVYLAVLSFLIMITDVVDADGVICGRIVFLFC